MGGDSLRVVAICGIKPIADTLIDALRELGHEPVALLTPRRGAESALPSFLELTDASAPEGLDLLFARDKHAIEPLLRAYEPDLMVCWGFPWKIPQAALDVPRLGSINMHPALLPRHRGPVPLAWALRDGDPVWGATWHYMDAELDTGNLLAQGSVPIEDDDVDIAEFGDKLRAGAVELLPRALERVIAGDPGDPQPDEGASWAGHFEDDDYVRIDWSHSGPRDPQPGARLAPHVRHVGPASADRRARRRAGRRPADPVDRPGRRRKAGRLRRRTDLGRRDRARLSRRDCGQPPNTAAGRTFLFARLSAVAHARLLAHERLELVDHVARLPHDDRGDRAAPRGDRSRRGCAPGSTRAGRPRRRPPCRRAAAADVEHLREERRHLVVALPAAGEVAPEVGSLVVGVAPVLDPARPARDDVVEARDVADRVDVGDRGAEVVVDDDAVVDLDPAALEEVDVGDRRRRRRRRGTPRSSCRRRCGRPSSMRPFAWNSSICSPRTSSTPCSR